MFAALSGLTDNEKTTTITIPTTKIGLPQVGIDTAILRVPADLVSPPPKTPGENPQISLICAGIAQQMARDLGVQLRMSGWWVTRDPDVVKQRGMVHDCEDCRTALASALAEMDQDGDVVMAVGLLSFG